MARRPSPSPTDPLKRASPRTAKATKPQSPTTASERSDQLVQLCDYCSSAHRIADAHGEKLLAYLLAMAIQEGQTALRRLTTTQATLPSK